MRSPSILHFYDSSFYLRQFSICDVYKYLHEYNYMYVVHERRNLSGFGEFGRSIGRVFQCRGDLNVPLVFCYAIQISLDCGKIEFRLREKRY